MKHRSTFLALVIIVLASVLIWPLGVAAVFTGYISEGKSFAVSPALLVAFLLVACLFALRVYLRRR